MNDKKHGYGVFTWPNGNQYKGMWSDGNQHGEGEIFKTGTKTSMKGNWQDGKRIK